MPKKRKQKMFNKKSVNEIMQFFLVLGIFFVFFFVLTIKSAQADIAPYIHYQGKLNDDKGKAVEDGKYKMRFRLYINNSGDRSIVICKNLLTSYVNNFL